MRSGSGYGCPHSWARVLRSSAMPGSFTALRTYKSIKTIDIDKYEGSDAQIAAICQAQDAKLATRSVKDSREIGVVLIDPWQPAP